MFLNWQNFPKIVRSKVQGKVVRESHPVTFSRSPKFLSSDANCSIFFFFHISFREDDMLDMAPFLQENSRLGIKITFDFFPL